jgi:peroxiredoxin
MAKYPITLDGKNNYAKGDNRDASGGCFVGRDVHANRGKDKDGVATPEYLNSVGKWLQSNVSNIGNGKGGKGLWCTNCHNQLSRELYQRDNLTNAFKQEGQTLRNKSLEEIAAALNISTDELKNKYLDPKVVLNAKGEDTPEKSGILLTWAKKRMVPDIAIIALEGNGPLVAVAGDVSVHEAASAKPLRQFDNTFSQKPFLLRDLEGVNHTLAEWKGKVIMLNFWATWCAPCQAEIGDFNAIQEEYRAQGLQIVGLGLDAEQKLRNVQRTLEINYPVLVVDPARNITLMKQWGNSSGIIPYTVVIDRDGQIKFTHLGPLHRDLFEESVLPLLGKGEAKINLKQ